MCLCVRAFDDIYLRLDIMILIGSQDVFTIDKLIRVSLFSPLQFVCSFPVKRIRFRQNADLSILDSNKSLFSSFSSSIEREKNILSDDMCGGFWADICVRNHSFEVGFFVISSALFLRKHSDPENFTKFHTENRVTEMLWERREKTVMPTAWHFQYTQTL